MSISGKDTENVPLKRLDSSPSEGGSNEGLYTPPPYSPTTSGMFNVENHTVHCPNIGPITVVQQGIRSAREVVILTVHDLGCDHTMYMEFIGHPKMAPIRVRTVWLHVELPGQGSDAEDLPNDYQFPTMQQIGEDLVAVLDQLNVKEVVCLGEGAGANIVARFAIAHITRVLGVCLLHATGTSAGFFESIKDKFTAWKLDQMQISKSTEHYLILHRFGASKISRAEDREELRNIVQCYKESLRKKANYKNLGKFVDSFLKRTSVTENLKQLDCGVLLVTGQHSVFNETTRSVHQALTKVIDDKTRIEFIEVADVANVLEEKPDKLAECLQYFLQGLGLVSSVPLQNVQKLMRARTLSMEESDKPMKDRKTSLCFSRSGSRTVSTSSEGGPSLSSSPTGLSSSPTGLCPIVQGQMLQNQETMAQ